MQGLALGILIRGEFIQQAYNPAVVLMMSRSAVLNIEMAGNGHNSTQELRVS